MQLKIKNHLLQKTLEFFFGMSLKGKESRHRTRIVNLLRTRLDQVSEEEMELLKEYAGVDKEGNIRKYENDNFAVEDVEGFKRDQVVLYAEEYVVEGGDIQETLQIIGEILVSYDEELSEEQADLYDYLCTQLEIED